MTSSKLVKLLTPARIHNVDHKKGDIVELPINVADSFIKKELATPADAAALKAAAKKAEKTGADLTPSDKKKDGPITIDELKAGRKSGVLEFAVGKGVSFEDANYGSSYAKAAEAINANPEVLAKLRTALAG